MIIYPISILYTIYFHSNNNYQNFHITSEDKCTLIEFQLILDISIQQDKNLLLTVGRKILPPPSTTLFFLSFLFYENQFRSFY